MEIFLKYNSILILILVEPSIKLQLTLRIDTILIIEILPKFKLSILVLL